jgi:hypothetical protein
MAVFILRSRPHSTEESHAMQDSADSTTTVRLVKFHIRDIHHPDKESVAYDLHNGDVLIGRVVATTDWGDERNAFCAIEVDGLQTKCIVPSKLCLPLS